MDLTKLTTENLKALAYDHLLDLERLQNNLKFLNEELAKRNKPVKAEPKKK